MNPTYSTEINHPAKMSKSALTVAVRLATWILSETVKNAVAKLQAASVPIAYAAAPWDRQTNGSRYSKMPP